MENKSKEFFKAALMDMKLPTYGVDMPDKSNSVTNAALAAFDKVDFHILTLNSELYVHKQKVMQGQTEMDALKTKIVEMEAKLINRDNDIKNKNQMIEKLKESLDDSNAKLKVCQDKQ